MTLRFRLLALALPFLVPLILVGSCDSSDPPGPKPDAGEASCDETVSVVGSVPAGPAAIDFVRARVLVRIDPSGCVSEVSLSLEAVEACQLHLEFWTEGRGQEAKLRLRFATLETDEGCPEIPAGRSYSLEATDAELFLRRTDAADSVCFSGTLTATGTAIVAAPGDSPVELDLSAFRVAGRFASAETKDHLCER